MDSIPPTSFNWILLPPAMHLYKVTIVQSFWVICRCFNTRIEWKRDNSTNIYWKKINKTKIGNVQVHGQLTIILTDQFKSILCRRFDNNRHQLKLKVDIWSRWWWWWCWLGLGVQTYREHRQDINVSIFALTYYNINWRTGLIFQSNLFDLIYNYRSAKTNRRWLAGCSFHSGYGYYYIGDHHHHHHHDWGGSCSKAPWFVIPLQ